MSDGRCDPHSSFNDRSRPVDAMASTRPRNVSRVESAAAPISRRRKRLRLVVFCFIPITLTAQPQDFVNGGVRIYSSSGLTPAPSKVTIAPDSATKQDDTSGEAESRVVRLCVPPQPPHDGHLGDGRQDHCGHQSNEWTDVGSRCATSARPKEMSRFHPADADPARTQAAPPESQSEGASADRHQTDVGWVVAGMLRTATAFVTSLVDQIVRRLNRNPRQPIERLGTLGSCRLERIVQILSSTECVTLAGTDPEFQQPDNLFDGLHARCHNSRADTSRGFDDL